MTILAGHYSYWITILLMVAGMYILIARGNLLKKLVGLSILQSSVYLVYIAPGKIIGGTAPIVAEGFTVYSNPLPHVLILTAIVIGFAVQAFALVLIYRVVQTVGTDDLDNMKATDT